MRARYARQIRAGILAARLPHRLRLMWVLGSLVTRPSELTMRAFYRADAQSEVRRQRWQERNP